MQTRSSAESAPISALPNVRIIIPPPPKLGPDMPFVHWLPRIKQQVVAYGHHEMLVTKGARKEHWPTLRAWLTQYVPDSDFHVVDKADDVIEALEGLRAAHTSVDEVTAVDIMVHLMAISLEVGEHPLSMISRAREMDAQLTTLKQPVDAHVLFSIIIGALKKNSLWCAHVENFMSSPGIKKDLDTLKQSLSAVTKVTVPGAFNVQATNPLDEQVSRLEGAIANLTEAMRPGLASDWRKHPYQRPGRGRGDRGRGGFPGRGANNRGGYGGGSQNGGRGNPNHKGKVCHNCGKPNHIAPECRFPCGLCSSKEHKATKCPKNPMSKEYRPPRASTPNPNSPRNHRGRVSFAVEESEQPVGYANMANFAPFKPLPTGTDSMYPPGFGPSSTPTEEAPPSDVFGVIGVAKLVSLTNDVSGSKMKWFMDSGASHHFTCVRSYLHNYVPDSSPVHVRVADKHVIKRDGVGEIHVRTKINGIKHHRIIKGVWYVPSFAHSLVSTQQLKRNGCWYFGGRKGDMRDFFFDHTDVCWLISAPDGNLNAPQWQLYTSPQLAQSVTNLETHVRSAYAIRSCDPQLRARYHTCSCIFWHLYTPWHTSDKQSGGS